ncbi:MAG: cob(I)yrinic acid a,c-diamide adenosyltransferase [Deltaproteobacteria bacterium]|nr:cob(I)yrinic acid a,c-diamide adenosyltransferase [Deltaproteobacteria bacterium]
MTKTLCPSFRETKLLKRGFVQLYLGAGFGKSMAVFGLAVRLATYNSSTYIARFWDKEIQQPLSVRKLIPYIDVELFGGTGENEPSGAEHGTDPAHEGITQLAGALQSGTYALVVGDALLDALEAGLVTDEEIKSLLRARPDNVELLLTGETAPVWLIDKADLVTDRRNIDVSEYIDKYRRTA